MPQLLYQNSWKSIPNGRHIYVYHVNVRTPASNRMYKLLELSNHNLLRTKWFLPSSQWAAAFLANSSMSVIRLASVPVVAAHSLGFSSAHSLHNVCTMMYNVLDIPESIISFDRSLQNKAIKICDYQWRFVRMHWSSNLHWHIKTKVNQINQPNHQSC